MTNAEAYRSQILREVKLYNGIYTPKELVRRTLLLGLQDPQARRAIVGAMQYLVEHEQIAQDDKGHVIYKN